MLKPIPPRGMSADDVKRYEQPHLPPERRDHRAAHAAKPARGVDPQALADYVDQLEHQRAAVLNTQDGLDHGSWAHEPVLSAQGVVVISDPNLPSGLDRATAERVARLPAAEQQRLLKAAEGADPEQVVSAAAAAQVNKPQLKGAAAPR